MGFAQQFRQQSELQTNMAQLRSMLSGDISPLLRHASNPLNKCVMPDGRELTFEQFSAELAGKSPSEAFKACGYDLDEVMSIMNS